MIRVLLPVLIASFVAADRAAGEPYRGPVLDMHLHAYVEDAPFALCIPWATQFPAWDGQGSWEQIFFEAMTDPPCDAPIQPVSHVNDQLLLATLTEMEKHRVVGVLSASPEEGRRWAAKAPDRFMPSLHFSLFRDKWSPEEMRKILAGGDFIAIGEVSNQYAGIAPDDPRMAPYWALAAELDLPVAIHMEQGVPGIATLPIGDPGTYRSRQGDPYLLEDILVRHPNLRVSVMHYGAPRIDAMIAIMTAYPQVYIDIGGMQWFYPRAAFHDHLKRFVDAGLGKRVMFGSDQGEWPGVIGPSIAIIDEAQFLSYAQKEDIFYNNAARFLRLDEATITRHRALAADD